MKNSSILIMAILIIAMSAGLFALAPEKKEKTGNNLSVEADKLELQVSDRLPISDYTASSLEAKYIDSDVLDEIQFSVASLSDKEVDYEIYLTEEIEEEYLDSNYVKILLTDTSGKNYNVSNGIVPSFSSLSGSVRFPGYRRVFSDKLEPGHIKQYVIKMWLSEEYLVKSEGKIFKTTLVVKSI